jgi:hypothetical protein
MVRMIAASVNSIAFNPEFPFLMLNQTPINTQWLANEKVSPTLSPRRLAHGPVLLRLAPVRTKLVFFSGILAHLSPCLPISSSKSAAPSEPPSPSAMLAP